MLFFSKLAKLLHLPKLSRRQFWFMALIIGVIFLVMLRNSPLTHYPGSHF